MDQKERRKGAPSRFSLGILGGLEVANLPRGDFYLQVKKTYEETSLCLYLTNFS